jgi:hypothetical protein
MRGTLWRTFPRTAERSASTTSRSKSSGGSCTKPVVLATATLRTIRTNVHSSDAVKVAGDGNGDGEGARGEFSSPRFGRRIPLFH